MGNERLEKLLEVFPRLADAVNSFASPDVQRDAFGVLSGVALGEQTSGTPMPTAVGGQPDEERTPESSDQFKAPAGAAREASASSSRKRNVTTPQVDGNLNIRPDQNQSLVDYAAEKNPKTLKEKSMVIVSWLEEKVGYTPVGVDQIFTCYKGMKWKVPKDLSNQLRTLSSHDKWLDTSDSKNISLTILGSQFVEHDLPRGTH